VKSIYELFIYHGGGDEHCRIYCGDHIPTELRDRYLSQPRKYRFGHWLRLLPRAIDAQQYIRDQDGGGKLCYQCRQGQA